MRFSLLCLCLISLSAVALAADCGGKVACACGDTVMDSVVLKQDLVTDGGTCLSIGAPNVRLDCAGHQIVSSSVGASAIYSSEQDGLEVLNCHIEGFQQGIVFMDGSNARFEGNSIIARGGSSYHGIWIFSNYLPAANNRIVGNKIEVASDAEEQEAIGIYLSGTNHTNTSISGNEVAATATLPLSKAVGIWATAMQQFSSNRIFENVIFASAADQSSGIEMQSYGRAADNLIGANSVKVESGCAGGGLDRRDSPAINIDGIRLTKFSDGNSISSNYITSSCLGTDDIFVASALHGFSLSSSSISGNSLAASSKNGKSQGMLLEGYSSENELENNTVISGGFSIAVGETTFDNVFFHNRFFARSKLGLYALDQSGGANQFFKMVHKRRMYVAEGNQWGDIESLAIFDTDADGFGDAGAQYPYSEANGAMVSIGVVDSGPMGAKKSTGRR